jgi:uncharacterized protein YecA (UPF0149 family)
MESFLLDLIETTTRKTKMILTEIDIQDIDGNWTFGYMHQILLSPKDWKRIEEDNFEKFDSERWDSYIYFSF